MTAVLLCILSLLVGFMFGVVARDALDLLHASREERKDGTVRKPDRTQITRRVAIVLVSLVLIAQTATAAFLIVTRENATRYAQCTAHWQQSWARAYVARYNPAVRVSSAMDDVVKAVAQQDAAGFHKAVAHYIHLRAEQNRSRARHPLPPLPAQVCGPPDKATR